MATLGKTLRGVAGAYARRRGGLAVNRDGVAVGSCGLRRLSSKDAGALSSNGVGVSLRKVNKRRVPAGVLRVLFSGIFVRLVDVEPPLGLRRTLE